MCCCKPCLPPLPSPSTSTIRLTTRRPTRRCRTAFRAWLSLRSAREEVISNNRPLGCLSRHGYMNLFCKFKERTGRSYSKKQFKNHWDALKREYTKWRMLKLNASGLGINPKTCSIAVDSSWP